MFDIDQLRLGVNGTKENLALREWAADEIERLRATLGSLRMNHMAIEDCWYSCPKAENYCGEEDRTICLCGADRKNAIIDAALLKN